MMALTVAEAQTEAVQVTRLQLGALAVLLTQASGPKTGLSISKVKMLTCRAVFEGLVIVISIHFQERKPLPYLYASQQLGGHHPFYHLSSFIMLERCCHLAHSYKPAARLARRRTAKFQSCQVCRWISRWSMHYMIL